jgi:hypothetical protein
MKDALLVTIIVALAITLGAFADRMVEWWRRKPHPADQYAEALSRWIKSGANKHLFDEQFNVLDPDREDVYKWVLAFPQIVSAGERDRLTYWFWGIIAYLAILGTLSAKVSIAAALSPIAPTAWPCVMAGLLGSCVAAFRSCLDRRANGFEDKFGNATPDPKATKERFSDGMTAWFVGRPLLGAAVGAMVFVAIRGRVFGESIVYGKLDNNPAMMIFYVWLAGLFAKTLLDLLLDLTKKVFRV